MNLKVKGFLVYLIQYCHKKRKNNLNIFFAISKKSRRKQHCARFLFFLRVPRKILRNFGRWEGGYIFSPFPKSYPIIFFLHIFYGLLLEGERRKADKKRETGKPFIPYTILLLTALVRAPRLPDLEPVLADPANLDRIQKS
jgi:hypothetical protein